jgi:hypothetical protein
MVQHLEGNAVTFSAGLNLAISLPSKVVLATRLRLEQCLFCFLASSQRIPLDYGYYLDIRWM